MPPKTHLAPRRYTPESLVQDSPEGRGRLFLHRMGGRLACPSKPLRATPSRASGFRHPPLGLAAPIGRPDPEAGLWSGRANVHPSDPLHSTGSIVISPAKGAKTQNLPMPPKTHLALRRYTPESLVQDSSVGGGRLFLHRLSDLSPALPNPCGLVAEVLRVFAFAVHQEKRLLISFLRWRLGSVTT
jgi:hypothetical protein